MAFDYADPSSLMGLLSLGSTGAQLGGGIYSALAKAAEERRLNQLMKAGPNVGQYYAPMSAAEAAGFSRGVMGNYQQTTPPGAYLDSLMGDAMAKRESDRYQQAYGNAYQDWVQRITGRQFQAGQQPGMPQNIGGALTNWLMLQQIMKARAAGQQPGATADQTQYGQVINPTDYSITQPYGATAGTGPTGFAPGGGRAGGTFTSPLGLDTGAYDGSLAASGTGGGGWQP